MGLSLTEVSTADKHRTRAAVLAEAGRGVSADHKIEGRARAEPA